MEKLSKAIRELEAQLVPGISSQEDRNIRAELAILRGERKKLEAIEAEVNVGISFYGSYFSNSNQ
jgi:hypothetical protein